jgi:hypothetical protein
MENCIKTGAYIHLVDYNLFAPADVFGVGESRVVRFAGNPCNIGSYGTPAKPVTHQLYLNRAENFWRKDLGVAVVDCHDLLEGDLGSSDNRKSTVIRGIRVDPRLRRAEYIDVASNHFKDIAGALGCELIDMHHFGDDVLFFDARQKNYPGEPAMGIHGRTIHGPAIVLGYKDAADNMYDVTDVTVTPGEVIAATVFEEASDARA